MPGMQPSSPGSPGDAFDASGFRALGHPWVERLADHLSQMQAARSASSPPVVPVPHATPDWMASWRQRLSAGLFPVDGGGADPLALLDDIVAGSTHLHSPGNVGHQLSVPLPLATLCDWLSAFLNNSTAIFEVSAAGTAMEQAVVRWMTRHLGWTERADGAFTSGGSLANLMGLLAARHERAGFAAWREGGHAGPPLAALASSQAHYCSGRAVQLMGWGEAGLMKVGTDARFRLRPELLEESKAAVERQGRRLIAVVASACSTATGSYDPLEPIADFCERHGLWLHVDGAHGASALLSPKYRGLLRGIERADSVAWDAHKMLMMPSLATGILFRDGGVARRLFAQEASYLFHDEAVESCDLGQRTIECTKRMLALPLYVCLATYGEGLFADHVTSCYDKARAFADAVAAQPDFELALEPQANIVCFRYLPDTLRRADRAEQNRWQSELRSRVLARGAFYLVQTQLGDTVYLRTTIMHPLTTADHLESLLDELRRAAVELG
jgi:L-2,4-diaminobutyrate decarboxylase